MRHSVGVSDGPKNKQPPASDFFTDESCVVQSAVCPHCALSGYVRIWPFRINGERHLHWHCSRCRHVWVERDRRGSERFAYGPPLAKIASSAFHFACSKRQSFHP